MKAGLVCKKLGMTQYVDGDVFIPVTVLKVLSGKVLSHKTHDKHGYSAVVFGYDELSKEEALNKLSKPLYVQMKKTGENFFRSVREFRVEDVSAFGIGSAIDANIFDGVAKVDIEGVSKGKGFAGVMKRYGFAGGRASHGNSVSHRSHGSTGGCQDPGRVFKNKKMAGHMGNKNNTIQNMKIFKVDKENGYIMIHGSVVGNKGNLVFVKHAIKG